MTVLVRNERHHAIRVMPGDTTRIDIVRRVANYPTWNPAAPDGYTHAYNPHDPDTIAVELLRYEAALALGGTYYYRPQWAGDAPEPLRLPA